MNWVVASIETSVDRITRHVERRGASWYLPRLREKVAVSKGRVELRESFLYPGYMFVLIDGCWRFLLDIDGVFGIIRSAGSEFPAEVPDETIQKIRAMEDHEGFIRLPKKPRFSRGQRVRLEQGMFEGQIGLYEGSDSLERERVLMNILGRAVPISVGAGSLAAA